MRCKNAIIDAMSGCGIVRSVRETSDGCFIDTGFTLSDFEVPSIYLEDTEHGFVLSDHSRTSGWLCNNLIDLTESRRSALEQIMRETGTRYDGGYITRSIGDDPGFDLVQMVTAIIRASDLVLLSRRTVRNTFLDDVKGMFEERFPSCETGKVLSTGRGERFRVDVYVDRDRPLLVI